MSRYKIRRIAAVFCILMAVALVLMTLSATAAPPAGGYIAQAPGYAREGPVSRGNARGDAFAWEPQAGTAWSLQQQEYDEFLYLPLVFKAFCGQYRPDPQRFGFGVSTHPVEQYDVSLLNAGWYVTFGFRADPPAGLGLEFAQTIRLCEAEETIKDIARCWPRDQLRTCNSEYQPNQAAIVAYATAHPGELWLIGNEPDAPGQDCIRPPKYAELYHELYGIIKGADPSAKVAIGGVVQGTPLRLVYLDEILKEYRSRYGQMIPVDVWNVHAFILPEIPKHGAGLPPGVPPDTATVYDWQDHDNMSIFAEQITRFRAWMNGQGERDKALIVTEYGVLLPLSYGFDEPRVERFMLATFDYFLSATSGSIGYHSDCDRLVQAWCWYSLDDDNFEGYNSFSHLFNPDTKEITDLGIAFGNYVDSLP